MVKVTPIAEDNVNNEFYSAEKPENESDFTDTESEVSEDEYDDEDLTNETFGDRIVALKDVIPPQYRSRIVDSASSAYSWFSSGASLTGKILWVVTTSSLLLGVPLSLSIISEQQLVEMEKEMKLTQSTNEVSI